MILKLIETYIKVCFWKLVLKKPVKQVNFQNVNQNRSISTFTDTFWCQLVLIIEINRLRDLKHQHLAGAFFLALKSDNSPLSFGYWSVLFFRMTLDKYCVGLSFDYIRRYTIEMRPYDLLFWKIRKHLNRHCLIPNVFNMRLKI